MSGRRIDDHSVWAGKAPKGSVFPEGAKVKEERSTEGAGHIGTEYPDTTEKVHGDQMKGVGKIKSHNIKSGYRN